MWKAKWLVKLKKKKTRKEIFYLFQVPIELNEVQSFPWSFKEESFTYFSRMSCSINIVSAAN